MLTVASKHQVYVAIARTMEMVFSRHYIVDDSRNDYNKLEDLIMNSRRLQAELFRPFETTTAKVRLNRHHNEKGVVDVNSGEFAPP